MLVGESIYQACKFYEMFVNAGFKDKVAIVTSYVPSPSDISKEDSGEGATETLRQYQIYRQMLAGLLRGACGRGCRSGRGVRKGG